MRHSSQLVQLHDSCVELTGLTCSWHITELIMAPVQMMMMLSTERTSRAV